MKRINRVLSACVALAIPLLMVGCSEDVDTGVESSSINEGTVSFGVTRASDEEVTDTSILKIYTITESEDIDGEGTPGEIETLIRRYAPMSEMPETISLVEGDYRATYQVGDYTTASFDNEVLSYSGSVDFEVVAQESQAVEIECMMENTVVRVEFDDTISDNMLEGYTVTVMAADSYDESLIGVETTPQLIFESDNMGYFLLPSGVSNISWKFTGEKIMDTDGGETAVEMTGVIESPQRAEQMTLQFSYPKYLKVTESFSIYVDDSIENHDDSYSFELQPLISGDDLLQVQSIIGDVSYTVKVESFLDIKSVYLSLGDDMEFYPFNNYAAVAMDEATFVLDEGSTTMGTLTINRALFDHFTTGGENEVKIYVSDSAAVKGTATMECKTSGITGASSFDLWNNTGVISALDIESSKSVKIEYRVAGDEDWIECDDLSSSSSEDGLIYSAKINSVWEQSTNASGNTVHQMVSGITSSSEYECRLTLDGVEHLSTFTSDEGGTQLTNYDMSDSENPAFTESSSSSSNWTSGNNSYADAYLCSSSMIYGNRCAKLTSTLAGLLGINKFAAGNIAYGQFEMGGTSGTMSFGQPFEWTARPQKFKVRYAVTLGTVNYTDSSVYTGTTDRALVYFAIVDWSSRHEVESGTSSTTGAWNPQSDKSVDEGNIIGYALAYIDESTPTTTELYDLEMDVYYYDKVTMPSKSISVVVSCASSAYGDYFVGSTNSRMWVDDFEIVY